MRICYAVQVITRSSSWVLLAAAVLATAWLVACHKEEQAVVGVAQTAVTAEKKAQAAAQAAATERDSQRAQLERVPLPTKSLYVDVKDSQAWANPFLSVNADSMTLRVVAEGAPAGKHGEPKQEISVKPGELAQALLALPTSAWRYGRVIAVAEAPQASSKDKPKARRNVEAAIKQLNDLGVVVQEWPTR